MVPDLFIIKTTLFYIHVNDLQVFKALIQVLLYCPMEDKIDLVLKGAIELFNQFGIKGVTMDQIARKAGVSKKSIYEKFADKEELLTGIVEQNLGGMRKVYAAIVAEKENPVIKIARIYYVLLKAQREYHPSLYWTMTRSFPKSMAVVTEFEREMSYELLPALLTEAKNTGIIQAEVNIHITCDLYQWFLQRITSGDFYELLNTDFTATFNHLILYNLRGLLSNGYLHILDGVVFER